MLFLRLFLICFIALGTFLILDVTYASAQDTRIAVSPIPEEAVMDASTEAVVTTPPPQFDADINAAVENALAGSHGTYSVVVKDLKTGATYTRDPDHVYATASLYKLWVMGETYHQIAEGKLSEDDTVSGSVQAINKTFGIASESAELTEGSFSMTIKEALTKMITISHNYAALMLTQKITSAKLKAFVQSHGFTRSKIGPDPTSTAADMALYYEKLYHGQLGTPEHTVKMLDLLAGQQINDRIPKYLPKTVKTLHKTGELDGVKHDAGIVKTPKGDYIIVLMSDTNNPKAAAEREAQISKNVYEYLERR
jgi:beta-lactamase class A